MNELALEEVAEYINSRITYKPGWTISAESCISHVMGKYLLVQITGLVHDAYNPQRMVPITSRRNHTYEVFTYAYDWKEMTQRVIFLQLLDMEKHELEEFFKVDGKHFKDPHPELRNLVGKTDKLK